MRLKYEQNNVQFLPGTATYTICTQLDSTTSAQHFSENISKSISSMNIEVLAENIFVK